MIPILYYLGYGYGIAFMVVYKLCFVLYNLCYDFECNAMFTSIVNADQVAIILTNQNHYMKTIIY